MHLSRKKILAIFLVLFISFSAIPHQTKGMYIDNLNLSANGAVLIDVNSGRILYEKNGEERMRIASLTKIMTAIVAIENGDLNDMVTTTDRAYGVEGSSIYLKRGEKMSLENMLYGLMLRSGNDAAVAIAEHVGGSLESFVYLMNQKATYIGMKNTHFMNPHGLDHKEHYSTPKDMAILTAYALKNPVFKKIVGTKIKRAPLEGEPWDRKWYNKNRLLSMYQWANGVKTGYTRLSKRCLASSATKDGVTLAVITLNAPDDWKDHITMLEYGFNNYHPEKLVEKGEVIKELENGDIVANSDFVYPLKDGEKDLIEEKLIIPEIQNQTKNFGKIQIYFNEEYIGSVPLIRQTIDK